MASIMRRVGEDQGDFVGWGCGRRYPSRKTGTQRLQVGEGPPQQQKKTYCIFYAFFFKKYAAIVKPVIHGNTVATKSNKVTMIKPTILKDDIYYVLFYILLYS